MSAPLLYAWTGEAMEPIKYFARLAAKQFKVGAVYRLEQVEARSIDSHKQYFAVINEAWLNLHEDDADKFASPDELRYWALTYTGFREVREYAAHSHAEALRVAKYLASDNRYCRLEIEGLIVKQYLPRSQSFAAMTAREFQASKEAVFDVLAQKLGIGVDDLIANAGRAA
jgi:hypothetical protein